MLAVGWCAYCLNHDVVVSSNVTNVKEQLKVEPSLENIFSILRQAWALYVGTLKEVGLELDFFLQKCLSCSFL